jgi:hypothetical protein
MTNETNTVPAHGWTCFHCDETFTDRHAAAIHFGDDIDHRAGCIEKLNAPERNLLLALRKVCDEFHRLQMQVSEEITNDSYFYSRLRRSLQSMKPFKDCCSLHEVFMLFDSLEGRVQAAEFWWPAAEAPRDGSHIFVKNDDPTSSGFGMYGGKRVHWHAVVHYWANPGEEGFYLSSGAGDSGPVSFTHWRPL